MFGEGEVVVMFYVLHTKLSQFGRKLVKVDLGI